MGGERPAISRRTQPTFAPPFARRPGVLFVLSCPSPRLLLQFTKWADDQDRDSSFATVAAKSLPESSTTLVELLAEYLDHAEKFYVKNGKPTSMVPIIRRMLRLWRELFGVVLVRDIKPSHLKALQSRMVKDGQARSYVNKLTAYSKSMFRWAVENDLCPASVWQGLLAVRGLAKGRTKARETEPVLPVADEVVDATTPHLPPVVQDMVAFQRHTGARPGEVCTARPCDVDRSGDVWLYRPESHKCEHHDRSRTIAIGPKAQEILLPYLLREATAFCFSPRESEQQRLAELHAARSPCRIAAKRLRRDAGATTPVAAARANGGTRGHHHPASTPSSLRRVTGPGRRM